MTKYRPGHRVTVPWGFDEVHGTVVHAFGPVGQAIVMVQVDSDGVEGGAQSEIGFNASDIKPAPGEAAS